MNGDVARRSSIGTPSLRSSTAPCLANLGRLAPQVAHRRRHLLLSQLALGLLDLRGGDLHLAFEGVHALLGGDQLLGLTGQPLLGDAQDLVEVGASLGVGDLELAPRLDLLEAAVEVGVVLRCGLELGGEALVATALIVGLLLGQVQALARLSERIGSRCELGHRGLELGMQGRQLAGGASRLCLRGGDVSLGGAEALGALLELALHGVDLLLGGVLQARQALRHGGILGGELLCMTVGEQGERRLELLASRADLRFQVGLTLEELGAMGRGDAVQLGAHGAQLVLEHRGTLLFGSKGAYLCAQVLELPRLRGQFRL